ncbi:phage head closure protein [Oxalobacteraceae bacterium]|nr:phage head closure protein [Oxalobacteraceae bacterium]
MSLSALLDKRITLQVLSEGRDAAGQAGVAGWINFIAVGDGKIWAGIKDMSGRELVAAGAPQNPVQTLITIRYRPGVLAKMRALHGADIYSIEAVLGQDSRKLTLACTRLAR